MTAGDDDGLDDLFAHAGGEPSEPMRSAANWFLDAATFARDGDRDNALAAARNGIEALLHKW